MFITSPTPFGQSFTGEPLFSVNHGIPIKLALELTADGRQRSGRWQADEGGRRTTAGGGLQQAVLLQLLAQGVAVDAQHLRRVRLVAVGARHDHFQYRLFHGEYHHVVDVRCLLLAQVVEVFLKTLLDYFLDTFFAHIDVVRLIIC